MPADIGPEAWLLIAVVAAGVVIAMLNAIALRLEREIQVYNLAIETARLRNAYAKRLAKLRAGEADSPIDAAPYIEVDEAPPASVADSTQTPDRQAA